MRRFNSFNKIQIKLASPEKILSWSYGEVKKPETINYRSLRPERDGLFCEKIFGTTKEWECQCGKFKSIRYKGVVCDRCGVEVSHFKVRRERMGHIQLATPVAHIWYYKSVPSRLGLILNLTMSELENIIYYEKYVVIDPGESDLEEKQLLSEEEYLEYRKHYGINFTADMGALALQMLLQKINLENEEKELRIRMNEKGERSDVKLLKRIELIKDLKNFGNRSEWMIIDVVPVIPPELRPMIQLDNGRFATSDLNDLYRRVINRNNRLRRLLTLRAPDIIIRNEKRMLQEAVDSLFDNSKRRRMIRGPGNRPLKSIADMLKGKQGRFRQNLLGKRVDYSGRSVIVVGPQLKLHQCGIPKSMALELFKPFVMRGLVQKEVVYNIKSAKKLIDKEDPSVWPILEKVIRAHPVLLNRAPTLHRLGIQAFEPILIEGSAIQLHPLVCHAFNADFDGDQMAVHVPLSVEAQIESWLLMLASNNLLNPANGEPIVTPTLDIVLGIYCLTKAKNNVKGGGRYFSSSSEVLVALENGFIDIQAKINVLLTSSTKEFTLTTPGRIIFNSILPDDIEFINETLTDKMISRIILRVFNQCGHFETVCLVDKIKELGFKYATIFGISIGIADIKIPTSKKGMIDEGDFKVKKIIQNYQSGYLTEDERYNQVVDVWTRVSDKISEDMMKELEEDQEGFNPLFVMAESGARGSKQQIRQLSGMRGLMAKPSGEILELPIKSNFKEGLTVLEYFISTHGARKGLADTAIKTADAGYLTRRLIDIAQDVVITSPDCGSLNGIDQYLVKEDQDSQVLLEQLRGRYTLEDIYHPMTGEKIVEANEEITEEIARKMRSAGIEKIQARTVITCELNHGLCVKCYGRNLATGKMVEIGEAVGIIAAQSIGQPGTQLTMRTFHIGGTAARQLEEQEIKLNTPILISKLPDNTLSLDDSKITSRKGELIYHRILAEYDSADFQSVEVEDGVSVLVGELIGLNLQGEQVFFKYGGIVKFLIKDDSEKIYLLGDLRHLPVKSGTRLFVNEADVVPKQEVIAEFDPYNEPILSEKAGRVKFKDIIVGSTLKLERSEENNIRERIIMEVRDGSLIPKLSIMDEEGQEIFEIAIPGGAHLLVDEGEFVKVGAVLAKIIRSQAKTKDITGGLPRIAELFEARKPKDACVIAECDGLVRFGDKQKGKSIINIEYDDYDELGNKITQSKKHVIPSGKRILVFEGDYIKAGEQLCDGPINPHDILKVESVERLQEYLVAEIQGVYRLQGVHISDKHVGIIIRQMLRKVEIVEPGDTDFIIGQQVDKFIFHETNQNIVEQGGKAAVARPILQGITRASLNINSFISAASFQETTKVLTNAAIRGAEDPLRGLKENVIIGHLIPAGTGMRTKKTV